MSEKKKRMLYKQEAVGLAVQAVETGMSINAASTKYSIPRSTLHAKVTGKYQLYKRPGPASILPPAEEAILVQWIFECGNRGHPITKEQLLTSVRIMVKDIYIGIENPFKNNGPGRSWYEGFFRRHPEIRSTMADNVSASRSAVNETTLRKWFSLMESYLDENNLLDIDPSRIFSTGETPLILNPKFVRVLKDKGNKHLTNIVENRQKETLTAFMAGNASGQLISPFILYPYQQVPVEISNKMPDGWSFGKSDSGYMTAENFIDYIVNVFLPWAKKNKIEFPVIMYVDGHAPYLTYSLYGLCFKNKIELIALPPNSTHILQPIEVMLSPPLKACWKKHVNVYRDETSLFNVSKSDVGVILKKVLQSIDLKTIFKTGFEACGLLPFSVDSLDFTKIFKCSIRPDSPQEDWPTLKETISNHCFTLKFIEGKIDKATLKAFRACSESNVWTGEAEYTQLFYVWNDLTKLLKVGNSNSGFNVHRDCVKTEPAEDIMEFCIENQEEIHAQVSLEISKKLKVEK